MGQEKSGHIQMVELCPSLDNHWGKNKNHAKTIRKVAETTKVYALSQELQAY